MSDKVVVFDPPLDRDGMLDDILHPDWDRLDQAHMAGHVVEGWDDVGDPE